MKTKKILALWAVGMLAILTIFCYGQGHTIRQFPTTNQLANADAFVVELGTGTTNMNVTKANMPGALGVPTLAQMYSQGASCTNNDTLVSNGVVNFGMTFSNTIYGDYVAKDITTSNGTVSFTMTVSNTLHGDYVSKDTTTSNGAVSFTMTTSNTLRGDYVSKDTITSNGNVAFTMVASNTLFGQIGAAAGTNVAMISAGWVEAGGGHFTNDLTVDGTIRVNTLNVGTLVVTSCPAFTVGNLNVVTNANVATLTASNNATFLAGATFVTAVTSSADSASNAPAANEFPNASWVRGLFNNGAVLYAGPGVRTDATNGSSGQVMYLFTNTIPATSSRKYAIPNAGDYVGSVMTSNALTFVQGPIYVHAFLQSSNGNGGQSISVHPEIYYSYDRTNWQGDFSANDQVIATGTNLYEWVISFPAITSTNSTGFWIERRFKVGAATGATHPDLYFHLGTNFASGINDASHISFSGPSSGTGNAYLANDQTFTGSNTFNGAINAASNINANRITATNRLTIGPTGSGTTFSNNTGVLTIRDAAGQTVGVIDNDATLGTAFWIISTPTSNSMAAAITADTNKATMAIGGGHLTNKMTVDGNIEFTAGLLNGGAQNTNYTLIAGTNTVYIGGGYSNVHVVAIMGGVAGRAIPMTIIITNGAGSEGHISFSAVTNAWHWPYSQGAPSVLTNNVQWVINLILDNTNVLAAWAAYAWP